MIEPWSDAEWRRLGREAYRASRCVLDANEDLEAIVQEVLAALWAVVKKGCAPDDPTGWVRSVARRKATDAVRRKYRDRVLAEKLEQVCALRETSPAADGVLFAGDDADIAKLVIEVLLPKLPPGEQDAVRYRLLDGLDRPEIAARMGIKVNTVKTHLRRGIRHLREMLVACGCGMAQ